jgi:hypothetical protein
MSPEESAKNILLALKLGIKLPKIFSPLLNRYLIHHFAKTLMTPLMSKKIKK